MKIRVLACVSLSSLGVGALDVIAERFVLPVERIVGGKEGVCFGRLRCSITSIDHHRDIMLLT